MEVDMKKINIALAVLLAGLVGISIAGDGAILNVGDSTYYFKVNSDGTAESSGGFSGGVAAGSIDNASIATNAAIAASKISGTSVTVATLTQTDTNVTTTATAYTPAFKGQILIGGAGEGTNAVWVAKGTTINDWVQVAP